MKVLIVNCFDTYNDRRDQVYEYFSKKGHNVTIVQSDYAHRNKETTDQHVTIPVIKYKRNMSIVRLLSHYKFSKDAFWEISQQKPDLLYIMAPPNSLIKNAHIYIENNQCVKLIIDVIDMWPESLPIGSCFKSLMRCWANLRNKYIPSADIIITECDYYISALPSIVDRDKIKTVYYAKSSEITSVEKITNVDQIDICYLGSINNIIDIKAISSILYELVKVKKTVVHVVGEGEKRSELLTKIKKTGAESVFYGQIFDDDTKREIFKKCMFGFNLMKPGVFVGLTMKSIDYMSYGLPLINNIQGDTYELIENSHIGLNVYNRNHTEIAKSILKISANEINIMKRKTIDTFNKYFSDNSFYESMESVLQRIK